MAAITSTSRNGLAILSYGFRPFFLLAALQAAVGIALWVPWFLGIAVPHMDLPPGAWHAHSLLYGYVWAVIAGFLLTAVPNWTGRKAITGWPLAVLVGLYLAGRVATLGATGLPAIWMAVLDLMFPVALTALMAREIIVAGSQRSYKVVGVLVVLLLSQALFHYEVARFGIPEISERLAVTTILGLIMLIGGRTIPAFTTNWLKARPAGRTATSFNHVDGVAIGVSVLALALWTVAPLVAIPSAVLGALLLAGGVLQFVRQARWAPERTLAEPLVAILHVAYFFVGFGFVLAGVTELYAGRVPVSAGLHAWTSGAIATMTLAIMTRASLGHTGQRLHAGPVTVFIYVAIIVAAALRIAAALLPGYTLLLLPVSGLAWVAAFFGFLCGYGPLLVRPRPAS